MSGEDGAAAAAEGERLADERHRFQKDWADLYYSRLQDGLWHTTSLECYRAIRKSGAISPSTEDRPLTYPQTANSYGLRKGCVCLFAFDGLTEDQIIRHHGKWTEFFGFAHRNTVALQLDRQRLADRLIPNRRAREETGFKTMWIPHVEAWYPGPIPLAAITSYLFFAAAGLIVLDPAHRLHAAFEQVLENS